MEFEERGSSHMEKLMQRPEEKKHDLRDDIYPPLPVTEKETPDPIAGTERSGTGDLPMVTPDPTKVPEGQTTRG